MRDWRLLLGIILVVVWFVSGYLAHLSIPFIGTLPYVGMIAGMAIIGIAGFFLLFWALTNKIVASAFIAVIIAVIALLAGVALM